MLHKEPNSSALTVHYTLSVDSGLSLASAKGALTEALKSRAVKSTQQGGATGFWQQTRSQRLILALEMSSGGEVQQQRPVEVTSRLESQVDVSWH